MKPSNPLQTPFKPPLQSGFKVPSNPLQTPAHTPPHTPHGFEDPLGAGFTPKERD